MLGIDHRTYDFAHGPSCNCCRAAFENTMLDYAVVALDMSVSRSLGLPHTPETLAFIQREDGPLGDPFLEFELTIASVLADHAASFLETAEEFLEKPFHIPRATSDDNIEAVWKRDKKKNWTKYTARIEEVVSAAEQALAEWKRRPLSIDQEDTIKYALEDAMTAGVAYTTATVTEAELAATVRFRVINGMMKSAKYYSNEFFNTQVMPALVTAAEKAVATPGDNLIYTLIKDVLAERLKSVPYWRVVANAAASRSYHYGVLKTAQYAGRRAYQFLAVIDERTSSICKAMNGTQWPIADAANLIERIADAEPEDVKNIAPWRTLEEIQPFINDTRQMIEMGVILPPLHGNCRSTVVIV